MKRKIVAKQVSFSEVQFHMMSANELSQRITQKTCPPRIIYDADYVEDSIKRLSCKVLIHGASIPSTDAPVFFRINVRPNVSGFRRQDAVDVPTFAADTPALTSSPLPSYHSRSSLVHTSSSGSIRGQSPLVEFQSPPFERSFSNSSQSSLVIHTPHVNVFNVSDHELDVDLKSRSDSCIPLEKYKEQLSKESLTADVSGITMRKIIMEFVSRWKRLSRIGFQLSETEIIRIESNYRNEGVEECSIQAFERWRKSRPKLYAIEALEIFYKSGEFDAVEGLIKELEKQVKKSVEQQS